MFIDVLVELKAKQIDKTFTYAVPSNLADSISIGKRVYVPFGRQELEGFIMNIHNNKPEYEVKNILRVIDEYPVINSEMLELGRYISKKTLTNLIAAYQTMLPSALKAHKGFNVNKKYVSYIKLVNDNCELKNIKQQQIVSLLKQNGDTLKSILNDISISSVKTLIGKGIILEYSIEEYRLNFENIKEQSNISLNDEQLIALNKIKTSLNEFKPFLLHGVTGSGKTEVYMHVISEVIKMGRKAIVLVPEISLTPQLVNTFKKRFGNDIAILHSRLSDGEKYDEWRKIERQEVNIVIGARSAIFAPLTNIGVIIIDEEHSSTYKQENNPKYSTIDIAIWRCKRYNCPIVLGSATPSIESYTRAKAGIYELLEMQERVNKNLPKVKLIDMKDEIKAGARIFSRELKDKINNCLKKDEQVILLLNRRGYSTIITCHKCGYTDKCPNCDIPLTYHKSTNTMRCHYCGYGKSKLYTCPTCKSNDINEFGLGTQKLEELVTNSFNGAKVVRMDVDTTSKKGSHEKIINAFSNKEYNVLIGTQMIAKGLDFKDVTLVGVINGDASLNIPDFRSSERTFQLLNQVAGRAGRSDKIGEVIIQGFNINHQAIINASRHDYKNFYKEEMSLRKKLNYPPFCNLCLIKVSSTNYEQVLEEGLKIANYIRSNVNNTISVLGPSSASIPKINKTYSNQIILKYKKTEDIINSLKFLNEQYKTKTNIHLDIDLNPIRL